MYKFEKGMKIYGALAARANGQAVDSLIIDDANKVIAELLSNPSPENMYQIGQLIAFTLTEMQASGNGWIADIADEKTIPLGGKAYFNLPVKGIRAFIQAKAATTQRSRVAARNVMVDTVAVSARPAVNVLELRSGMKDFSALLREANVEMSNAKLGYVQAVLRASLTDFGANHYASGAGVVQATLDPMILRARRSGGAALLGDIAVIDKLAPLTGFTYNTNQKQYSDDTVREYDRTGIVGFYKGATVGAFTNPYLPDGTTLVDPGLLFILPVGLTPEMRNLKIVNEGPVMSFESTNIDDLTYEVRLDQHFGAAVIIGDQPSIAIYEDTSL